MRKFKAFFVVSFAFVVFGALCSKSQSPKRPKKKFAVIRTKLSRERAKKDLKNIRDKFTSELHKAIIDEDFDKVQKLVKKAKNKKKYVNFRDYEDIFPLYIACAVRNNKIIAYLVRNGADVNAKWKPGMPGPETLPGICVTLNDKDILKFLLRENVKAGLEEALFVAFKRRNLQIADFLITGGWVDVNMKDKQGRPLIFKYAYLPGFAQYLVGKGASIKATDKDKNTLLHIAALGGDLDCMRFLIEHGLDVNAVNKNKHTPLHYAAAVPKRPHAMITKFLVEQGAKVDVADKEGNTPLSYAAQANNLPVFEFLLERGADINKFNKKKVSPLAKGNVEIARCAFESGQKITIENIKSSLQEFCKRGAMRAAKYVLEKMGDELPAKYINNLLKKAKQNLKTKLRIIEKSHKKAIKEKNQNKMRSLKIASGKMQDMYDEVIKILENLKSEAKGPARQAVEKEVPSAMER